MDVRIGVTYSPKELTIELDSDVDLAKLKKDIDAALEVGGKASVLWLTYRRGRQVGVPSDKVAYELDWYADWSVNDNFIVSFIAAVADPKEAVEQSSGRTDKFVYGMIFAAYSF